MGLEFLNEKMSEEEMKDKMLHELWKYVKRQNTWFKRNKDIRWFEIEDIEEIDKEVSNFLN